MDLLQSSNESKNKSLLWSNHWSHNSMIGLQFCQIFVLKRDLLQINHQALNLYFWTFFYLLSYFLLHDFIFSFRLLISNLESFSDFIYLYFVLWTLRYAFTKHNRNVTFWACSQRNLLVHYFFCKIWKEW